VLVAVAAGREWHVKDLAAECALDPSTVSRAAAALVRAGLVERTADPADGRAGVLTATDAGRRALDEILACYDHRVAAALHDWTREEMRTFAALAQRFAGDLMSSIHPPTSLEAAR
jgi:DNA-binding MarR family transcriptional regulator